MARLFSDGAELGSPIAYFWDYDGGYTDVTAVAARSGSYGYRSQTWGGATIVLAKYFSNLSELYYRMAYVDLWGATEHRIYFRYNATTIISFLYDSAIGRYNLYANGVYQSTFAHLHQAGYWHLWEIHVVIADAPNGIVQVKIDGITELDWSGDTLFTYAAMNNIALGARFYVDDIALNDTSGIVDNSWCGDEHYEVLMPNDNGDTNSWTGSDGDKVNNYALVDERPPSGADYVYSNTPTEQDMYKVTDFTATGKIVTRIWPEALAIDASAGGKQVKLGYKHGGSVYLGSAKTLSSNYTRVVGADALVDPSDSNPWEDADLDNIQFVVERE